MSRHHDHFDDDYDDDERDYPRARAGRERHAHDEDEGAGINKKEVNRFASDAFKQSAKALDATEIGKTKKLFGLFEVDAGIIAWAGSIYNVASDYASQYLAPKAFNIVKKYGPRPNLS